MLKSLNEKIEKLTLELVSIPSVVGTKDELNVATRVYQKFTEMAYFKKHPHKINYVMAEDDPLQRKSVLAVVNGEKKKNKKTVVLIGHTDTVGVSDYDPIRSYATKPLELVEKLKELTLPEDALADLESGNYLFGRGVFDMKCGVAILMNIVEYISDQVENFDGNIVFAAVCDEEGGSKGMLSVVHELIDLQNKEGLEYLAVIDTDYSAPRFEGDNTRYIYVGTVGKLMPSFYVVGSEAHAGDPFKGIDSNHISSAIMEEVNFNTKYCDWAEGEVTVPPISLRQQDLKPEYSVQTTRTSCLYFNFSTHSSTPDQMMKRIIDGVSSAFQKVVDTLNEEHQKYCEYNHFPCDKLPWEARVLTYEELYRRVKDERGPEVDRVLQELSERVIDDPKVDERIFALELVETLHNMWSDKDPVVVVYFSPPYYPHIYVKDETPLEKNLLNALDRLIKESKSDYQIVIRKFYPYISDLSYAAAPREENAIASLRNNMPGFGVKYRLPIEEMQKLDLPVVNIGPFGKDAHKFTERLEKDYSFNVVPGLVYKTILNLLEMADD